MERRLETISIKYSEKYIDENNTLQESSLNQSVAVVVTYRNIENGIPQKVDTISIGRDSDYSECEEKVKKICQIAFEEQ